MEQLIQHLQQTVTVVRTNMYFDFQKFREIAIKENYQFIVDFIFYQVGLLVKNDPKFEIHINMKGFNISSFAKYHEFMEIFTNRFVTFMDGEATAVYIYFTPSIMTMIMSTFQHILKKRRTLPPFYYYTKAESDEKLSLFYNL